MAPCANAHCENTVSEAMQSGFCFTCLAALAKGQIVMHEEIEKTLHLEAQFVRYCEEHGLPNPHE